MVELLSLADLPEDFAYPREFLSFVELGITDFDPWSMLLGARLRQRYDGLLDRYPHRRLLPFAERQDNDDVACFDLARQQQVCRVHDWASPGWEARGDFAGFHGWLRQAVEDLIYFHGGVPRDLR